MLRAAAPWREGKAGVAVYQIVGPVDSYSSEPMPNL
jgi:hypothetical protein